MLKFIERTLDKYVLPNPHFQNYINHRYNSNTHTLIEKKFLTNTFCTYHNTQFHVNDQLFSIDEVLTDYHFSDIRPTDIVLDIGANIGAFTLFAAKKAKHVYAIEPLYTDILHKNIAKNNIKNVTILETGIGTGKQTISYNQRSKEINLTGITDIIKECGKVDFLKCDCEGCEWNIKPDDLKGVRRIEIEVHRFHGMPQVTAFKTMLNTAGFDYEMDNIRKNAVIIHGRAKK